MKKKLMLFAVSLLAAFPAGPGMADGINSAPGVTLPIGAGGSTHVWVNPNGNVYVGTATGTVPTAYAKLDVQGEVKPGKSVEPCNHIYNEGAIRYDKTTHSMLYCNENDKWVPLGAGDVPPGTLCGSLVGDCDLISVDSGSGRYLSTCREIKIDIPCNGVSIVKKLESSFAFPKYSRQCPSGYTFEMVSFSYKTVTSEHTTDSARETTSSVTYKSPVMYSCVKD